MGHNGPEETTLAKQGFGYHIEMGFVNEWRVGGDGGDLRFGEMSVQSMGKMGKDFCPNFLQPLLENVDERRMGRFVAAVLNYITDMCTAFSTLLSSHQ